MTRESRFSSQELPLPIAKITFFFFLNHCDRSPFCHNVTEISLPPIAKNNTLVGKLCCDTLHKKRIYLSARIVNIISQVNQLHEPNRSMKDGAINFAQDILQDIISLTRSKHNYINNFLGFERLGIIGSNYKHESLQRLKHCKV